MWDPMGPNVVKFTHFALLSPIYSCNCYQLNLLLVLFYHCGDGFADNWQEYALFPKAGD